MVNTGADRSPERARQDYVKVIYQLGQETPVRAAELARHLGVSRVAVSKFKRMLERERLLYPSRRPTDALRLTKKGRQLALRMVRRHRLVETFLHSTLRMPLDRIHGEAERIEHAISEDVSARLARFLDHPSMDPHGHSIPASGSTGASPADEPLASVASGSRITVTRIDDRSAEAVRRLAHLGVLPGRHGIVERNDGTGVRLRTGRSRVSLSKTAVRGVHCVSHSGRARSAHAKTPARRA